MALAAVSFVFFAGLIVGAGTLLSRHADIIAEATGLGRLLVGSVLLAAVTSLPEFSVDIASVRQGTPNIAVGDLLGSGLANLLILAVLDLWRTSPGTMLSRAAAGHALSATVGIGLTAVAGAALLVERRLGGPTFLGLGVGSTVLVLGYLFGVRMIFIDQRIAMRAAAQSARATGSESSRPPLRNSVILFAVGAGVILLSGPRLAAAAQQISELSGLSTTFVGSSLVALSTSLPEFVTCLAAVRMGAPDLAIGNVYGSNAFNMAILGSLDFWQEGSLLAVASEVHAVSALFLILATVAALAGQLYHAEGPTRLFERDAWVVLGIVLAGFSLLYLIST